MHSAQKTASRVKNLTFQGLTFANTDYSLFNVDGSHGKATVQGATGYIAYGDGNWHNSKYEITDTLPGMSNTSNADSLEFAGNVVKHSGSEGISIINDVINTSITGNYITDIAHHDQGIWGRDFDPDSNRRRKPQFVYRQPSG
jgi:hypothetical protein